MAKFRRTCPTSMHPEGKIRYATRVVADAQLDRMWRGAIQGINRSTELPSRSYKCEKCRGYHHTRIPALIPLGTAEDERIA